MATKVFYPYEDGAKYAVNPNYAVARAFSDNPSWSPIAAESRVGQVKITTNYYCFEFFLLFDTSTLPAGAVVSAAEFSLYGHSGDGTYVMELRRATTLGDSLDTYDIVAGADLAALVLCATYDLNGGWSAAGYNDFADEAGFADEINPDGLTGFVLHCNNLRTGTSPTSNAPSAYFFTADEAESGERRPRLTVTYDIVVWGANTVSIDSDAEHTHDNDVVLTLSASATLDGQAVTIDKMRFSEDDATWGSWVDYDEEYPFQLSPQTTYPAQAKTVYAQFRVTEDGDDYDSVSVHDHVDLEVVWTGSLLINGGSAITRNLNVILTLAATSSAGAVTHMRFSNDNSTWGSWVTYATSYAYTLVGTMPRPGTRQTFVVYVQFKDDDDNTTAGFDAIDVVGDAIVYMSRFDKSNHQHPVFLES